MNWWFGARTGEFEIVLGYEIQVEMEADGEIEIALVTRWGGRLDEQVPCRNSLDDRDNKDNRDGSGCWGADEVEATVVFTHIYSTVAKDGNSMSGDMGALLHVLPFFVQQKCNTSCSGIVAWLTFIA